MKNITNSEIEEIVSQILGYLYLDSRNKDSLIGICDWWLIQGRINYTVEAFASAIRLLLSKKLIVEKNIMGSEKIYEINNSKKKDITKILTQPVNSFCEILD